MTVGWVVASVVVSVFAAVWLLVVLFQIGDIATAFLDSRTARDRDVPGRIARERTNELFWIIPIAAVISLVIGLGLDHAGHLVFDTDTPALGTLFLLGVATLVVGMGGLTLVAVEATDRHSYSSLRRELRDLEGERLQASQMASFRARLARTDARTRSRIRPAHVLRTARSILRLASLAAGLALFVSAIVAAAVHPTPATTALAWITVFAPILNGVFATLEIRFALLADIAWRRVYRQQRADIITLLENLERTSRKGVAGLGDRVARALQILREQQQ